MKNYRLFSAAAALLASAASLGATATPAQAEGFRIEAHGGWDHVSNGVSDSGILYGIGVGYDLRVAPRVTVGIEANADLSSLEECGTGVLAAGDRLCVEARRDLSAVARIGYDVAPRSRLYALAGYTNGRFRVDYTPAGGATVRDAENLDGLRLGLGFQQGFANNLYSKIEYRYSNYEAGVERHQVVAGIGVAF